MSVLEQCASDIIQENGVYLQQCACGMDYVAIRDPAPLCLCEGLWETRTSVHVGLHNGMSIHIYMLICATGPVCKRLLAFMGL